MTTKALILAIAPELSTFSDAAFNQAIADSMLFVDSTEYGSRYEIALRYHSAHLLTLVNQSSSGGINSDLTTNVSEQAGRVSVTKAKAGYDLRDATRYDQTKYGSFFITIRKSTPSACGFLVV